MMGTLLRVCLSTAASGAAAGHRAARRCGGTSATHCGRWSATASSSAGFPPPSLSGAELHVGNGTGPSPFLSASGRAGSDKPHLTTARGMDLLLDPMTNRGTAFSASERERLGLRGLVPPATQPLEAQVARIMVAYGRIAGDLDRHAFLSNLHDRNITLFYVVLLAHFEDLAPVVYTPTVGDACRKFHVMFRRARGMYFSADDVGEMRSMVWNWNRDVDVVVVTDGSRVLGLGDLGVGGMGIPVGKGCLYTAGGGIDPLRLLPVVIDVGTDNEALREDPLYLGLRQPRLRGAPYFAVVDEWVAAIRSRWPNALIQCVGMVVALVRKWGEGKTRFVKGCPSPGRRCSPAAVAKAPPLTMSCMRPLSLSTVTVSARCGLPLCLPLRRRFEDFATPVAAPLLETYRRPQYGPVFNDDIQSTGTVAVATVLSSMAARGLPMSALPAERIVCVGAGSAGLGVCDALASAMARAEGSPFANSTAAATSQFWMLDEHGLLSTLPPVAGGGAAGGGRPPPPACSHFNMAPGQARYARGDLPRGAPLVDVIRAVRPTVLLGLSGAGAGTFSEPALRAMAAGTPRPVVLPLSNPLTASECTAEEAFRWTGGAALFASGSPYADVPLPGGRLGATSQCNNVFIFCGVGLAVVALRISTVSDGMFHAAAIALARLVDAPDRAAGRLLPRLGGLREVSVAVAAAVAEVALAEGVAGVTEFGAGGVEGHLRRAMWEPHYRTLVPV